MKVKALQKIYYGRLDRKPGDIYEMDDRESTEIKVLVALGKIEVVPSEAAPAKYSTTFMQAEEQSTAAEAALQEEHHPTDPVEGEALLGPRRYRRRDMRAQR